MKFFSSSLLVLLAIIGLLAVPLIRAEDPIDENDEDVVINDDTPAGSSDDVQTAAETENDEEGANEKQLSSPFVTTNVLFVQPESLEFPAGKLVKLLVGFYNNGSSDFVVESIEASLRYPQDFSYHIQNFTHGAYNRQVPASHEATFEYGFIPSEVFALRPFGLVINMNYRNAEGQIFTNNLFNETINIIELDEGFDGETLFLYIFLVAIVVLLLVAAQHFFSIFSSKSKRTSKTQTVKATNNGNVSASGNSSDIDLQWIPKEHLQTNRTPKTSPRQRKSGKQSAGSASETEAQ